MSGFVQHDDGRFCSVVRIGPSDRPPDDMLPVKLDWDAPAPQPGEPVVGRCRNCGQRGTVYEPQPADPGQDELAERFAAWFRGALDWDVEALEPDAPLRRKLFDLHARVGVVVLEGGWGTPPVRVQQCRECGGNSWPCKTLRTMAEWHHRGIPGWDERWSA